MSISGVEISRPRLLACGIGIVAGALYTLSPVTVWCGLITALVVAWATRDVSGYERVWLVRLLAAAIALRVAALVAFFLVTYPYEGPFPLLIPDEITIQQRTMWFRSMALGFPLEPTDYVRALGHYAESGHQYLFAFVQLHLGPSPYAIRLVSMVLYLTGTLILYRTVRSTYGVMTALCGLALTLFLPSLFAWSISALKEPAYLCLAAAIVGATMLGLRATTRQGKVLAVTAWGAAVLAIGTIRVGAHIMVGGGVIVGLLALFLVRRPPLALVSIGAVLVVGTYAVTDTRLQDQASNILRQPVIIHAGHVYTPGWNYRLLDPHLYGRIDPAAATLTGDQLLRYVLRAFVALLLVPLPWAAASPPAVAYLVEHVVWYLLLVLAMLGAIVGARRDLRLTCVLGGIILVSGAAVALTGGNVGTLVRHRAMVLMPLAWLGSLGAVTLISWGQQERRLKERNAVSAEAMTT